MSGSDCFALMGVGGIFLILGLAAIIWGKHEEKSYFNSLSTRAGDMREFVDRWPPRPQPGALRLGGWLAITIGSIMLLTGVALWLWVITYT